MFSIADAGDMQPVFSNHQYPPAALKTLDILSNFGTGIVFAMGG